MCPFVTNRGAGAVPGKYAHCVGKGKQLGVYGGYLLFLTTTWEVGAADAALEECVTAEEDALLLYVETESARGMAWGMTDL